MVDVAGVNDVEAAVTVYDGAAGLACLLAPMEKLLQRADLAAGGHGYRLLSDIRPESLYRDGGREMSTSGGPMSDNYSIP